MPAPKVALRKVEDLKPDPRNARTHSPDQVAQLAASISRFGWTNPILTDDLVRAGHGRLMAARLIYDEGGTIYLAPGKERGGAAITKGTVPVIDCTGWTEDERTAYALADNQLALNAGWDSDILTEQLGALSSANFDLTSLGFDEAAMASLGELGTLTEAAPSADRTTSDLPDSTFQYEDQFAVIVKCKDEAEQEAVFNRLREDYGADNVKVVVV